MKYGVELHLGGGLFSHYAVILANLDAWLSNGKIKIDDELYFDSRYETGNNLKTLPPIRSGMSGSDYNIYDYLFEQNKDGIDKTIITEYPHGDIQRDDIPTLERYKHISGNMISINKTILEKVDLFIKNNFKERMLGVHVRMTDLNTFAVEHGSKFMSDVDYFNKIEESLLKEDIDKIFVASDNLEMVDKLSSRFDICHYGAEHILKSESITKNEWVGEWLVGDGVKNWVPEYYVESMIDSILLSHCNVLVGRRSALNYASHTYKWCKINKNYEL